ncbi:MAG TPA: hypothetical protein DCZ94_16450 [Lentisphaeria bacterium]|nr:MAG: hypothetical protein A2X48_01885 [Lentisphaerae bacterium GWF2_49_21]HBC88539.1 hypothetical protein [Lentisphaeria bacterium]
MQREVEAASEGGRAMKTKWPGQIAVVLSRDIKGKCNPITVGWHMTTSFYPPMMAISIGKTRYPCEIICNAKEFIVAFITQSQYEEYMSYGSCTGRNVDKLKEQKTVTRPASRINSVLMDDANSNFVCPLINELETGDHCIFSAEIVSAHMNTKLLDDVK